MPEQLHRAQTALAAFDELAAPRRGIPPAALTLTAQWLHGRVAAAQGDTATARARYQQEIATPRIDGDDIPLHRAFAYRDYALLLETAPGDQQQAAACLQEAHRLFTDLGATPHADRVTDQLDHLGTRGSRVSPPNGRQASGLTERESSVARLAAQGLTNQEIAHELYVSPKTVEYHLGHVYTKLQLTGRRPGLIHSRHWGTSGLFRAG